MAKKDPRVLRDYILLQTTGITSTIVSPTVETNNFESRVALISFVEKDQFVGCPTKNPHIHLCNFITKCNMIKLNGVSTDVIRLRLFIFSLKDRASD